jgi:hypothetical protein
MGEFKVFVCPFIPKEFSQDRLTRIESKSFRFWFKFSILFVNSIYRQVNLRLPGHKIFLTVLSLLNILSKLLRFSMFSTR